MSLTSTLDGPSPSLAPSAACRRLLPPAADRPGWESLRRRLPTDLLAQLREKVAQAKTWEIKPLLASHYRAYMDTGDRVKHQAALEPRRANLAYLALGVALLDDPACLGPLEDLIWATCEETTWVTPAVARGLPAWKPQDFEVELLPAMAGLLLATVDHMLEDQLDAGLRQRVVHCLEQRVVDPFLTRDYWWLHPPQGRRLNNWTSVCSAGALACVTLMPALAGRRQAVVDRCLQPLIDYMHTFDEQGGCEEGGSYWVFGVDYLTLAAELLQLAPAGPDLYTHPRFKAMANFLPRIFLGDRQWITFSDCRQTPRVNVGTLARLDQRMDVPAIRSLAARCDTHLEFLAKEGTLLHALAWWPEASSLAGDVPPAEACVFFAGLGWMISRADPADSQSLVLSAHAGHNGFSHNHNDVGHVSVHHRTLPLLVDLGVPVYDRDYFSPRRITYLVASSLGHSVPQVNGQLQLRGEIYGATVLHQSHRDERDELTMDLRNAYGLEAGLSHLVRTAALVRAGKQGRGHVEVCDAFTFVDQAPDRWRFVSAVITTGRVTPLSPGRLLIENGQARGVFSFDPAQVACTLEMHRGVVLSECTADCTRICLSPLRPVREGSLSWHIEPEPFQDQGRFILPPQRGARRQPRATPWEKG